MMIADSFQEWLHGINELISDQNEIILDLSDDDLIEELHLKPHEELFLRTCLSTTILALLYVSILLHESLLWFVLAHEPSRSIVRRWGLFVCNKWKIVMQ